MEEDHAVMEDQSNTDSVDKVVGNQDKQSYASAVMGHSKGMVDVVTLKVMDNVEVLDEKDYFLVKFESEQDYIHVLMEGLWTIFGSYLTMQPWSRNCGSIEGNTGQEGLVTEPSVVLDETVGSVEAGFGPWMIDETRKRRSKKIADQNPKVVPEVPAVAINKRNAQVYALRDAGSPNFRRYLWEHCWESRPEIFVLLETRISGVVADKVIRNLGFYNSFRVEVHGFSGGIWILWQEGLNVEIITISNQFIHGRCWSDNEERWLYFTVIYAIPQVEKWKMVWKHLMNLMPGENEAWILGGSFNFILRPDEREGGSSHGSGVLWNGAMSESFKPTRGLRQGDPLSPYLFVLCMERLPHAISIAVNNGKWKPIRLCRSGPNLSHLFFADDFVLFVEASIEQCSIIRRTLEIFCRFSASLLSDYEISVQLHSFEIRDKLTVNSNQLWIPVLRSKYKWRNELPESIDSKICSNVWKGISQVWSGVRQSLVWNIGNGQSVEFWRDSWLSNVGPLNMFVANQLERDELLRRTVTSMVDSNGHWQWELIIDFVPSNITQRLAATMPPQQGSKNDVPGWKWNIDRCFLVKSAYEMRQGTLDDIPYKNRNRRIFDLEYIEKESVLVQGRRLCFEANRAIESSLQRTLPSHRMSNEHTHWSPPPTNWCKVNTDGSCKTGNGFATCGGVIRSSDGSWILGFGKLLGICSIIEAELWGIHEGLSHAWNLGERQIMVEADSLEVIRMLQGNINRGSIFTLLDRVSVLLNQEWTVTLRHINRDANKVADKLARLAAARSDDHTVFYSPPPKVLSLIQHDSFNCNLAVAH
ncbi:hypothetical protein F3Y22_tig00110943pilonHSYRG00004 [Hibiscus syriacus]|uniref:RNase H type-1 domain-containing protein n=1 Tax=Hibiscus syriacus TaxID=106335 RepID=A0A6A2ZDQ3_HIBSY|nr:hypothetical protein F3Y22_tig00110943pilonHSYRG00004 [Hibiscus syriacus]